ncbi:MAG TPA: lysylphosphatidylglycerol synthase domain-containing protein, partial [Caulobacteraceae bacterium]|nr:lysylphosphatidylglycerol synthase domain-containing protein [Caulobacteraceae bacterium]
MLLAVALAALVLAHVMRAVRHATLFPAGRRPRTFHLAVGLSLAYVVDTVVPLRVGELVRAVYVSLRAGQGLGRVLATIVFERMSDLFAVALILLVLPRVVAGAPHTSALV